jgi:hypothetical protein
MSSDEIAPEPMMIKYSPIKKKGANFELKL